MNLKSKTADWRTQKFAYLMEPTDPVHSDQELYDAVKREGRAVLREFEGASYRLGPIVILTPETFEATWQGD